MTVFPTLFPILLIGLIAWLLPAVVPRSVPFGVRIPGARAKEPVIARQRQIYRYGVAAITLVVAAVLLATGGWPPLGGLGVAAELGGAFALLAIRNVTGGLVVMAILGAVAIQRRRHRLWLWRGTALVFEDVLPTEVEPLKLSAY